MRIRVGHLYPEYLNIYADRGNIAVLRAAGRAARPRARGDGDLRRRRVRPGEHDLLYIGGGQDREQLADLPRTSSPRDRRSRAAVADGAALLAVCGGYQLLGRGYLGRHGDSMPGIGLFPHETSPARSG